MPNENEEEPKITVVDRRMLSDDERAGRGEATPQTATPQIVTSSNVPQSEPVETVESAQMESIADDSQDPDAEEMDAPSEEEMAQMRAEMEAEQFAAIEARVGRPLTETEKESVRAEMENQAREQAHQMTTLEVAPMMQQFLAEISARAAIHMGLMPNPYTRLVAKNDAEARLAIDTFAAVLEVLKPRLEPTMEKEFTRVLNDLRVNFAQQTGLPAGGFGSFGGSKIIH